MDTECNQFYFEAFRAMVHLGHLSKSHETWAVPLLSFNPNTISHESSGIFQANIIADKPNVLHAN